MRLDSALREARTAGRTIVVPYLLVDRARRSRLAPTVRALRDAGATALELGFPFSDPIADGPVLESAANRALAHGTSWTDLLEAGRVASEILPTAVMTYANPVFRHGLAEATAALSAAGVTGLIVPDLSLEESAPWRRAAGAAGLSLVLLAAPGGSPERIGRIARATHGFLYLVAYYGTTGRGAESAPVDLAPLVAAARLAAPSTPILVGFGVRDRSSARRALATGADGVVVGTALEQALQHDPRPTAITRWLGGIASAGRR